MVTYTGESPLTAGPPPRAAAVLLLFYPDPHTGATTLVFTRRTAHLSSHAGQISFPGGRIDPTDRDAATAALRETEEELGIPPATVTITGLLTPVHTVVSNYLITPVIGHTAARPLFHPNPAEVAEVIEVPLAQLRDPAIHHREARDTPQGRFDVHYFQAGPHTIWGATARILRLFFDEGAESDL